MGLNQWIISLTTLSLLACGQENSASQLASSPSVELLQFDGRDSEQESCRLSVERDEKQNILRISLAAAFTVDYKVPMPFSGLYGVYRWAANFDSLKHATKGLEFKRSWLGDADVITAEGEPLFWNTGTHEHKLVIKPSLAEAKSLTYESKEKVGGVVTTVVISQQCSFPQQ